MGERKLINKTIEPLQITNLTPLEATRQQLGYIPIGVYKGMAAFWDLDKSVNQPLALAEAVYSIDRIDGRDAVVATLPLAAAVGTVVLAQLTVPTGELWILSQIHIGCPAPAAGEEVHANFRVSSWPFPDVRGGAVVNDNGRAYLADDLVADDTPTDIDADIVFNDNEQLGMQLRLAGGSVLTLVATQAGAVAAAANAVTLTPHGRKARLLVV